MCLACISIEETSLLMFLAVIPMSRLTSQETVSESPERMEHEDKNSPELVNTSRRKKGIIGRIEWFTKRENFVQKKNQLRDCTGSTSTPPKTSPPLVGKYPGNSESQSG